MNTNLNGLRILNTRPTQQGQLLRQLIHEAGGVSIDCPTLEIKATSSHWVYELPNLNDVNQAIFISANAVEYCFMALNIQKIHWPKHIHVIAIGQGTAKALQRYQIQEPEIPAESDSVHLLALPSLSNIKNQTVLLFKGEGGRSVIEEGLTKEQAKLLIFSVYQRIMPTIDYHYINSIWRNDAVDIILLTSEQSINNLFKLFGPQAQSWIQNKPCLVLSQRLAQVASLAGIKINFISHPNRIIDTLLDYKDYIHGEQQ